MQAAVANRLNNNRNPLPMQELLDALPSAEWLGAYLSAPQTWWQIGVFVTGILLARMLGRRLQSRLQPVIRPGVTNEVTRTAMRTGALVLVPAILWLWLLGANAAARRLGIPTELLRPTMLLVGALALIRMSVFVLRHSFSPGSRLKAWEGALTVTIWILVALHILGWLPYIAQALDEYALAVGEVRISLYTIASFALLVALLLLAALWISNAIHWRVMRSQVLDESLKIALSKLSKFTLLTLAVLSAMIAAGIDLTAFAVFGGALGVGLGLGLQRVVSNFVSGVILAFEGSIKPGDVISIGQIFGAVQALHARHIVVHTRDGLDILVPNENLLTSEITNWSYEGDRRIRVNLPVQIAYDDDPERAIALLQRIARELPEVLADPGPEAVIVGFGDNGVAIELHAWVGDPERVMGARAELYRRIFKEFKAARFTFPFPQREVRLTQPPARGASRSAGTPDNRAGSARGRKRARGAAPRA